MDQDSGRGSRRSTPRRDGQAARPKHQLEEQPPAAPANPLPLPRRSAQAHIEPQLRQPGGSGTGTPFNPFAAPDDAGDGKAGNSANAGGKAGNSTNGDGKAGNSTNGDGKAGNSTNGGGRRGDAKRAGGKRGDAAPEHADDPKGATTSSPAAAFKKGTRQGRRRRPPAG